MQNIIPVENTPTSLSPDDAPQPLNIVCYDSDYPEQPCPICQGMGVIKYNVPIEDSRFGKFFRCPNHPVEIDEERQKRLRRLSNLDAFVDKTFENFELPASDSLYYSRVQRESLRIARDSAVRFAQDLQGWLLLEGSYGTGKTHLAAAIGNLRLLKGDMVLFITAPDLLDHLRSTFGSDSEIAYDELFERLRNAPLLILDDLGVENPSAWAKEKLFQLLNYRYSHRKATVITTNVNIDDLDPRIRSRLLDIQFIRHMILDAPDYRNAAINEHEQVASRLTMYNHMGFENFDIETHLTVQQHNNLLKAAQVAEEYANQPQGWLLFTGSFGAGKTHLAAAVANYRRNLGDEVMFITVPDLLDYLRTTFEPNAAVTFDKLFNQVRNVQILILDDLGTESAKPWAQEKLFQLLDYRYVSKLPTIITTSKSFDDLNQRIVSRLIDARICRNVAITAPPYATRIRRR